MGVMTPTVETESAVRHYLRGLGVDPDTVSMHCNEAGYWTVAPHFAGPTERRDWPEGFSWHGFVSLRTSDRTYPVKMVTLGGMSPELPEGDEGGFTDLLRTVDGYGSTAQSIGIAKTMCQVCGAVVVSEFRELHGGWHARLEETLWPAL